MTIPFGTIAVLFIALIPTAGRELRARVRVLATQPGPRAQRHARSLGNPNLPRLHGAGEAAALQQGREQLIEHPGAAVALIHCDVRSP